jgi:hypothetical protein
LSGHNTVMIVVIGDVPHAGKSLAFGLRRQHIADDPFCRGAVWPGFAVSIGDRNIGALSVSPGPRRPKNQADDN